MTEGGAVTGKVRGKEMLQHWAIDENCPNTYLRE